MSKLTNRTVLHYAAERFKAIEESGEETGYFLCYKKATEECLFFARTWRKGHVGIGSVVTNTEYRNRRVCTKSMRVLVQKMLVGEPDIRLWLREDNVAAGKCYTNVGFRYTGAKKGPTDDPEKYQQTYVEMVFVNGA